MIQVAEKMRWEAINTPELDNNGKNALKDLSLDVFTLDELIEMKKNKKDASLGADVVLLVGLPDLYNPQVRGSKTIIMTLLTISSFNYCTVTNCFSPPPPNLSPFLTHPGTA